MIKEAPSTSSKPFLTSAPPPWHTILLIAGLLASLLQLIPTTASIDEIATTETFTIVIFPEWLTLKQIAIVRLFFGTVMIGVTLYYFFFGSWEQDTDYYRGSKLQDVRNIPFRGVFRCKPFSLTQGLLTLSSFTMIAWTIEGIAFLLLGAIPLLEAGSDLPPWVLRLAIVCWEISAPSALLVSAVVKFVLWPMMLFKKKTDFLKKPLVLMAHNLNVMAALMEASLLGGLSVRFKDFALGPLFGIAYILFSYTMMNRWADRSHGPQFLYPFLDTTLNWNTSFSLLALLAVMLVSYTIVCFIGHFLVYYLGGGIEKHALAVVLLGSAVCRFRD